MARTLENWRNWIAWWCLGLANNAAYVVFLTAAENIVSGQAGAVLAADIIPTVLVKLSAPLWAHYVSYNARYAACTLLQVASLVVVATCEPVALKLLGVCLASIGTGFGEVTSLANLAFYRTSAVGAWSSGTGMAGPGGAGFYVLMKLLGVSDSQTMFVGLVFPAIYATAYFVVLEPATVVAAATTAPSTEEEEELVPSRSNQALGEAADTDDDDEVGSGTDGAAQGAVGGRPEGMQGRVGDLQLSKLTVAGRESVRVAGADQEAASTVDSASLLGSPSSPRPVAGAAELGDEGGSGFKKKRMRAGEDPTGALTRNMSVRQRLEAAWSLLPVMASLFLVYLCEYTINSGTLGTLSFPADGVTKHAFYQRAQLVYQVGVFVARSSGGVAPINVLWPMPLGQAAMLAWFCIQSLTQAISSSWLMLGFVAIEGLLGGLVYVNAFRVLRERSKPELREFNLGTASIADSVGIAVAACITLWLEPALDAHRAAAGLPVA